MSKSYSLLPRLQAQRPKLKLYCVCTLNFDRNCFENCSNLLGENIVLVTKETFEKSKLICSQKNSIYLF